MEVCENTQHRAWPFARLPSPLDGVKRSSWPLNCGLRARQTRSGFRVHCGCLIFWLEPPVVRTQGNSADGCDQGAPAGTGQWRLTVVNVGPSLHGPRPLNSGTSQLHPLLWKCWGSGRDSTYFSIANSTLVLPRSPLRFPVLTSVLPILLCKGPLSDSQYLL